jgi:hypothetical protein
VERRTVARSARPDTASPDTWPVGVVGFFVVFIPFVGGIMQLIIPAAAVVLGFLGRRKEPAARAMWLTGIILGFVGIAIALISIILWSIAFASIPMYYGTDF